MRSSRICLWREASTLEEWGMRNVGPSLLKESDGVVDALLFGGGQCIPPVSELIGEFDFPRHVLLCHRGHYAVTGITARRCTGDGLASCIPAQRDLLLHDETSSTGPHKGFRTAQREARNSHAAPVITGPAGQWRQSESNKTAMTGSVSISSFPLKIRRICRNTSGLCRDRELRRGPRR